MSTITFTQVLDAPLDEVWDVHTRPGIVNRLMPGFSRFRTVQQASNLRDGTTLFKLPGGLSWNSTHDPAGYEDRHYFKDICVTPGLGPITGWRHKHQFEAISDTQTLLTDQITLNLPAALAKPLLKRVFAHRHHTLAGDLARMKEWRTADAKTIAVTGSSGLVGTQLCALLEVSGHEVIRVGRDEVASIDLTGVDAVVHLGGHPIAGRFTDAHLKKVRDSRVKPTHALAENAARCGVQTFVCASAVGFYGNDRSELADETAAQGTGELAQIVAEWEAACQPARDAGLRVVNVRSGLVLAGGSPMLDLLTASVRVGGGKLGTGQQHFAWVSLDDVVDIYYRSIFDATLDVAVNAVGPERVTNEEFTRELARVAKGKDLIPVPKAAPTALLGERGAEELALADQNVEPAVLQQAGHRFRHATVRDALRHEVGGEDLLTR
ncbi:TIGR01777 family oxidoreductase [Corynebacterium urogenitale]